MAEEKRVKDIMLPIEEYDKVDMDARLCDALGILKRNHESLKIGAQGHFHRTLFVTDAEGKIVGKLSMYDLLRGLVPEPAKQPEVAKAFRASLTSRAREVADQIGDFQEHFAWLHNTFFELVKQEAHKGVKDLMSVVHDPTLREEDTINQAIYTLFKDENRQQLVHRDGEVVGVINLNVVFNELIDILSPECNVPW